MRCPTCDRTIDPEKSQSLPFCSERCRQIDLGRWLGEKHSVPAPPRDPEEEPFDDASADRDP